MKTKSYLTYRTASPKSAMQQVPLERTNMFLLLTSRWAMAGFPVTQKVKKSV